MGYKSDIRKVIKGFYYPKRYVLLPANKQVGGFYDDLPKEHLLMPVMNAIYNDLPAVFPGGKVGEVPATEEPKA